MRAPGEWKTTWLLKSPSLGARSPLTSVPFIPIHSHSQSQSGSLFMFHPNMCSLWQKVKHVCLLLSLFWQCCRWDPCPLHSRQVPYHQATHPVLAFWSPFIAQTCLQSTVHPFHSSPKLGITQLELKLGIVCGQMQTGFIYIEWLGMEI